NRLVKESLDRGERQQVFLPVYLWASAFIEQLTGNEHVIIDGSPRTILEAEVLDTAMMFYQRHPVQVIFLELSEEKAIERLLKRGRHDDTEDGIKERLRWYREEVMPVIDYYRTKQGYTVISINGDQTVDEVHQDIVKALGL